jgi:TRAP-type C4-dicarboxylate transport system substrate-binding protein
MRRILGVLPFLALLLPLPAHALELKIATLAPKNSAWAKAMEQGAKQAAEKTGGRLTMKYYFSGQQGDERDMVRKMESGAIDGAVVTAVGLGIILPEVRVLELPTLFESVEELDDVRDAMTAEFEKRFAAKGYVLVTWGDVGWVHTFSTIEYKSIDDLKKAKAWVWSDDPITRAMQKRLGINGVPLGVPAVLSALTTGQIDTCYGSPLSMIALQWYTKVRYASDKPLSYAIGGFVVRKDVFDQLSAEDQKAFLTGARENSKKIIAGVRKDNDRARKALVKNGIVFFTVPPETEKLFRDAAAKVWGDLTGQLYPKELLDQVVKYRDEARAKYAKKKTK